MKLKKTDIPFVIAEGALCMSCIALDVAGLSMLRNVTALVTVLYTAFVIAMALEG